MIKKILLILVTIFCLSFCENPIIHKKIIEIGDWNMRATAFIFKAHNLGENWDKIRNINVLIRNDTNSSYYPLLIFNNTINGSFQTTSTDIILYRVPWGYFTDGNFLSTSYNRGFLIIEYVE